MFTQKIMSSTLEFGLLVFPNELLDTDVHSVIRMYAIHVLETTRQNVKSAWVRDGARAG